MRPDAVQTHSDERSPAATAPAHHVCPWWLGYFLACPLRRLTGSPERLLGPHIRPGMTIVEPGPGMGYFTVPMARLVGPSGRVVCVDLQPKMLDRLMRRARKAGVADRITARLCKPGDLELGDLAGGADLAVAIHMIHEVPDRASLLRQLSAALRPGGSCLVVEPAGHVSSADFAETLAIAAKAGLRRVGELAPGRRLSAVLIKEDRG